MKTRQGFVSNSSSSSFIALADAKDFCDDSLCVQITVDLRDIFDVVIRNEAELKENLEDLERFNLGLTRYAEITEALKNGKIVCIGTYDEEQDSGCAVSATMMEELLASKLEVVYFGRLE